MCISPIQLAQECPYSRISAFLSHQRLSQRWLALVVLANQRWCPSCWGCMTPLLVSASSHCRVGGLSRALLLSCSGRGPNYAKTCRVRVLKCQKVCSQERNPLYKGVTFKNIQKACQAVCILHVWPLQVPSDFPNSTSSSPVLVSLMTPPLLGEDGQAAPQLREGAPWVAEQHRGESTTLGRPLSWESFSGSLQAASAHELPVTSMQTGDLAAGDSLLWDCFFKAILR